jgi:hypothetical protein
VENILLIFCRNTYQYTPEAVAAHLGTSVADYLELESGQSLIVPKQAEQLACLYNTKSEYFYEAAELIDLLLAHNKVIHFQREQIRQLRQLLANPVTGKRELI